VSKHLALFPLRRREENLWFTSWLVMPSIDLGLVFEVLLADERPFLGVLSPSTFPNAGSDNCRVFHTRLCCAFRFSQPRDALFRPRSLGLISCRIRPWGFDFQRFLPPRSHHGFHRALPLVPSATPKRRFGMWESCTWEIRSHCNQSYPAQWSILS